MYVQSKKKASQYSVSKVLIVQTVKIKLSCFWDPILLTLLKNSMVIYFFWSEIDVECWWFYQFSDQKKQMSAKSSKMRRDFCTYFDHILIRKKHFHNKVWINFGFGFVKHGSKLFSVNIGSGSEANKTTSCEMEIFNFLWLIWDHYLPLAHT